MRKTAIALSIALALGLLAACGSDGVLAKQDPSPTPSAVSSVEGVVLKDGQGQFHVGGVPLDTSGAKLTINGKQCPMSDLQPGMTVEARGSMGGGSGNGSCCSAGESGQRFNCSSISVNSMLTGDIESMDAENKTLVVVGMTVVVDASTFIVRSCTGGIGAGCAPIAFDALNVGDCVNICGTLQQDGSILASRICLLPAGTVSSFTTQGAVSGLD
jgi:hypothetical protein